ncbi:MAG: hypothetical protein ACLPYZ_00190 [Limisphaerales bacterium]
MKKILSLILMLSATTGLRALADGTNETASSCDAEISIKLKEPAKEIKTNEPVILTVQIKNTSTNEMLMFRIENMPTDFTWAVTSPSGKDLSPKPDLLHEAISGWFPKLKPLESREIDFDLSSVCSFNEVGIYKVVAKKQVVSLSLPKKGCEIVSKPLDIVISK